MKIVMTNTATGARRVVSFNDVCRELAGGHYNNKGICISFLNVRRMINYRLLNNETIIDGNCEFKREINQRGGE